MSVQFDNVCAVILAAGKGTRMNNGQPSPKPKVLYEVNKKPLISFSIDAVKKAGISKIVIVVGYMADMIKDYLGRDFLYAYQNQFLGTADAVKSALGSIPTSCNTIAVTYGDDFYDSSDLSNLISKHITEQNKLTLMTAKVENPTGFGRVKKEDDQLVAVVEEKMATDAEKLIDEVNTGMYVFDLAWLKQSINKVPKNSIGEYYLTDLVAIARSENAKVGFYLMQNIKHWLGINSPEQLAKAAKILG